MPRLWSHNIEWGFRNTLLSSVLRPFPCAFFNIAPACISLLFLQQKNRRLAWTLHHGKLPEMAEKGEKKRTRSSAPTSRATKPIKSIPVLETVARPVVGISEKVVRVRYFQGKMEISPANSPFFYTKKCMHAVLSSDITLPTMLYQIESCFKVTLWQTENLTQRLIKLHISDHYNKVTNHAYVP